MTTRQLVIDFFPLLIVWSLFAGIAIVLGKRKGVGPVVAILGTFPLWVAIFALWLIRKPDLPEHVDH